MWRCFLFLSLMLLSVAQAAPAWTWVDENGRRHFSDRPFPGATQIELPESRPAARDPVQETAPNAALPPQPAAGAPAQELPDTIAYTRFDIIDPIHEQTLWNIGGNLPIRVALEPRLQAGHQLDAVLDGQRMQLSALSEEFTVPDVYRGLHTLQAVVIDTATGEEVVSSLAITIMVQQTSILNPNNPRR